MNRLITAVAFVAACYCTLFILFILFGDSL